MMFDITLSLFVYLKTNSFILYFPSLFLIGKRYPILNIVITFTTISNLVFNLQGKQTENSELIMTCI